MRWFLLDSINTGYLLHEYLGPALAATWCLFTIAWASHTGASPRLALAPPHRSRSLAAYATELKWGNKRRPSQRQRGRTRHTCARSLVLYRYSRPGGDMDLYLSHQASKPRQSLSLGSRRLVPGTARPVASKLSFTEWGNGTDLIAP